MGSWYKDEASRLVDEAEEASASSLLELPLPVQRCLTTSQHQYRVPRVHCRDPSGRAEDVAVPEVDLGGPIDRSSTAPSTGLCQTCVDGSSQLVPVPRSLQGRSAQRGSTTKSRGP